MNIEDLADFPALRQLEKALWKEGKTRGAAIFIGSGFSRNAELIHERTSLPPVWSDLIAAMESRSRQGATVTAIPYAQRRNSSPCWGGRR